MAIGWTGSVAQGNCLPCNLICQSMCHLAAYRWPNNSPLCKHYCAVSDYYCFRCDYYCMYRCNISAHFMPERTTWKALVYRSNLRVRRWWYDFDQCMLYESLLGDEWSAWCMVQCRCVLCSRCITLIRSSSWLLCTTATDNMWWLLTRVQGKCKAKATRSSRDVVSSTRLHDPHPPQVGFITPLHNAIQCFIHVM